MYQPKATRRDKLVTLALVILVHVGLAFALVNLSGPVREALPAEVIEIFDVTDPPPPPPEPVVVQQQEKAKPKEEEGEAWPENVKGKATEVKDTEPRIPLPVPQPMPVSKTPNDGGDKTQGASDTPGQGTGAGGVGTGTGSGGSGNGTGGGGGGGNGVRLVKGITNRDYPKEIQRAWPKGGRIFVRVRVQPDGRVSQCDVMRSFGNAAADQWTCSLVLQRAQFRPATDVNGKPVAAWFGYVQGDTGKFER